MTGVLAVDDDELAACVSCGLCLAHCPTYRVTGLEAASPRGRIAAMRAVQWEGAALDAEFTAYMDGCVQCRGCETACPSGVGFGRLMESARATLARRTGFQPRWRRVGYRVLGHHRLLLALTAVGGVAQRMRLLPRRLGLPPLPLRQAALAATPAGAGGPDPVEEVWLFPGCVMDAWMRSVHQAAQRVVEAAGGVVSYPGAGAACCGALHAHAGLVDEAAGLARRVVASFPGNDPILVDSAGCGAALKGYGERLGTEEAARFAARVLDVSEWLAARVDRLPPPGGAWHRPRAALHDPCHLRHVQRTHLSVRAVLAPYVEVAELDDEGLCCGAGGAYAAFHADVAAAIRDRKVAAVGRTGAGVVASANPGCAIHLAGAGLSVRHPVELIDAAIRGDRHGW